MNRLIGMRVGPQISRMIVGAPYDTKQISGVGELKADIHVRRVLGRVFAGGEISADDAHRIANIMIPGKSWMIDAPLYLLGKSTCRPTNPDCTTVPSAKSASTTRRTLDRDKAGSKEPLAALLSAAPGSLQFPRFTPCSASMSMRNTFGPGVAPRHSRSIGYSV